MKLPKDTIVPNHIAMILDGNGRWARSRDLNESKGHEAGGKAVREVIQSARDLGVHTITLWGFSTENWNRPKSEVMKIMNIVKQNIKLELKSAHENKVRFIHIGRKDRLPKDLLRWILRAEKETLHYRKHTLNLAIDYGGREEIIYAVKRIISDGIGMDEIDENLLSSYLYTHDQPYPYPDLLIRTSGEQRTSGLYPWQCVYSELYFEPDHLPDFNKDKLVAAILDYSRRRRRFGAKDKVRHFKFRPEVIASLEVNWWRLQNIPEGTKFVEYSIQHIREQFGLSKELSRKAAKHMIQAVVEGEKSEWDKAVKNIYLFYKLIKDEVKLAFEPSLAASLQVKFWREIKQNDNLINSSEIEQTAQKLYSEVYRMSALQAAKLARLRVLASRERILAEKGMGDHHWDYAEDYLQKFYSALKERIA